MDDAERRRSELRDWLRLRTQRSGVVVTVEETVAHGAFERRRVSYPARDGDVVPAYLLVPRHLRGPAPGVLVHHQHNGERHLGKSEVCGIAGDPLQAFGAALADRGCVVLAPDSICFEDRRTQAAGVDPHPDDGMQHFNEMCCRLLHGDTLLRKVLEDAETALSVLAAADGVDPSRVGVLGHSYGGNTVLFQAALDERVQFACSSGAACSFADKIRRGTGIEMALVVPGLLERLEVDDLLRLTAPRPMLVVSATEDRYSRDADEMVRLAAPAYEALGRRDALEHVRYEGGHAVTRERFDRIVEWTTSVSCASRSGREAAGENKPTG